MPLKYSVSSSNRNSIKFNQTTREKNNFRSPNTYLGTSPEQKRISYHITRNEAQILHQQMSTKDLSSVKHKSKLSYLQKPNLEQEVIDMISKVSRSPIKNSNVTIQTIPRVKTKLKTRSIANSQQAFVESTMNYNC